MSPKIFYFLCFLLFVFSCEKQDYDSVINSDNIEDKISEAIFESEDRDNISLGIDVLHFIDRNRLKFSDNCTQSRLLYLRILKNFNLDGYNLSKKSLEDLIATNTCNDNALKSYIYNMYAIYYASFNKIEEAEQYYQLAIDTGSDEADKKVIIDPLFNLSNLYKRNSNFEGLIEVSFKALKAIENSSTKQNRLKFILINLAIGFINLENFTQAQKSLIKAEQIIRKDENNILIKDQKRDIYKAKKRFYEVFALYYKEIESLDISYKYHIKSDSLSNLWNKEQEISNFQILTQDNILKESLLESNKDVIHKQKLLLYVSLISILIITFLLFRIFITKNKLREILKEKDVLNSKLKDSLNKIEESNSKLKKKTEEVQQLLDINEKSLFSKTLKLSNYKDAVNGVLNHLNKLMENNSSVDTNKLILIDKSFKSILSEEEIWQDFKFEFEKNKPKFFEKLLEINPKLSIIEQKHCAYVAVNLKSKEVATILNLSPRSIETTRYRIKKKLDLKEKSLSEFLREI